MLSLKDGIGHTFHGHCYRLEKVGTKTIPVEILQPIDIIIESVETSSHFHGLVLNDKFLVSFTDYYKFLFNL